MSEAMSVRASSDRGKGAARARVLGIADVRDPALVDLRERLVAQGAEFRADGDGVVVEARNTTTEALRAAIQESGLIPETTEQRQAREVERNPGATRVFINTITSRMDPVLDRLMKSANMSRLPIQFNFDPASRPDTANPGAVEIKTTMSREFIENWLVTSVGIDRGDIVC